MKEEKDFPEESLDSVEALIAPAKQDFLFFASQASKLGYPDHHSYHGLGHIYRVLLLSLIYCYNAGDPLFQKENEEKEENKSILVYFALLHDIGRTHDWDGDSHGEKSVKKIREKSIEIEGLDLTEEGKAIASLAIHYHSKPDAEGEQQIQSEMTDRDRALKLYRICKDMDGLDRVRFGKRGLNISQLRTDYAKSMASAARTIYRNHLARRLADSEKEYRAERANIVKDAGKFVGGVAKDVGKALDPGRAVRGLGKQLGEGAVSGLKRAVKNWPNGTNPPILVICDGDTAEFAAKTIYYYLKNQEYKTEYMSAAEYSGKKDKFVDSRAIIVGHNDLTKKEKCGVTLQFEDFGMRYGINPGHGKCVLWVRYKSLPSDEKRSFADYYNHRMSQYESFARHNSIPLTFGRRDKTKKSQYDLLCTIFVHEALPGFLEGEKKAEPPPGVDPGAIAAQFRQDAPESPYITEEYLRQFCKDQQKFAIPPGDTAREGNSDWEVLFGRSGWRIKRHKSRDAVRIEGPDGKCCAAGTTALVLSPILNDIHAKARIDALKARDQLKYGIVFDGGGTKGAFQIGVWRWLAENGMADRFTGIAGASVGALNTLLFAQGSYENAERVWTNMRSGALMQLSDDLLEGIGGFLQGNPRNLGMLNKGDLELLVRENMDPAALRDKLAYVSLCPFTTTDEEITQKLLFGAVQHIDGKWRGKGIPFDKEAMSALKNELRGISTLEYTFLDGDCVEPFETNVRKALASAAFPGAYTPVEIDGKLYIDGGLHDNSPVTPLINAGFREIVAVHLSPRENRKPFEQGGATIWPVFPKTSLGDMFQISPEQTADRMQAGYEAAADCLKDFR